MSIKTQIDNFTKSNSVNGIELVIQQDGSYVFNFVTIKKKKTSLITENSQYGIKSIDDLKNSLDVKSPCYIVINGKGVITKKVQLKQDESVKGILNKVLPNANDADFCYQKNQINDSNYFVSIIRKDILNGIFDLLVKNGLVYIIDCFIGPIILNNCFKTIEPIEKVEFLNYNFILNDNQIIDFSYLDTRSEMKTININGDSVSVELLNSFGAGLSYFIPSEIGIQNSSELVDIISNAKEKKKFFVRGYGLLIFSFFLLLINYVAFNHYWSQNNELNSKLEINTSSLRLLDTLKKELNQKSLFLEQNGMLEVSMTSYYADQIAQTLPNSLNLTELIIHPIKKQKPNEELELLFFENNQILVTGNCKSSTEVNEWMKVLKSKSWVSTIELINYKQENAKEIGVFTLQITIL